MAGMITPEVVWQGQPGWRWPAERLELREFFCRMGGAGRSTRGRKSTLQLQATFYRAAKQKVKSMEGRGCGAWPPEPIAGTKRVR